MAVDLTTPPLVRDRKLWTDPNDYSPCQELADHAREAGINVIRYESVRDPGHQANIALLSPAALDANAPSTYQTWRMLLRRDRVDAVREMPRTALSFTMAAWAATDPRIPTELSSP